MLIDFKFLPSSLLLSSNEIFKTVSLNFKGTDLTEIKRILYIVHREQHFAKPDYIHKNNLKEINDLKTIKNIIIHSFNKFSKLFYWRGNFIYIKDEEYVNWQNIVTHIPPLSLLVYKLYKDNGQIKNIDDIINQLFSSSTIPSIYNPHLEELFKNEKLSETHMHINGTTETDYVWEDALAHPKSFYDELKESFDNMQVNELYKQIDISFSPKYIYEILSKAKTVRHYLTQVLLCNVNIEDSTVNWDNYLNISFINTPLEYEKIIPTYGHPYAHKFSLKTFLAYEAKFLFDSFSFLDKNDNLIFTKLFYFYLLSKSIFHKVIVQQTNQYGFDQFEKITVNQIREFSEKRYYNRFTQLKGMYNQDFEYIEARFSPKDTKIKLKKLLDGIIADYELFCENEKKLKSKIPELALVGHFIKKLDKRKVENIHTHRDYPLRIELDNKAKLFIDLLKSHPKYTYYIRGIDAAGNELYARPEVFAPAFRYITKRVNLLPTDYFFKKDEYLLASKVLENNKEEHIDIYKLKNFTGYETKESENEKLNRYFSKEPELGITYHAGEDFIHLISGIRMIYEAVEFLDMPSKSRIGHATALGISPNHWINCIGDNLKISKGEWLDNLIFISFFLSENNELQNLNFEIKDSIDQYWKDIYDEIPLSLHYLKQVYLCRKLDPKTRKNENNKLNELDKQEWDYEKILSFKPSKKVLELFDKYHMPKCIEQYNKMIEIEIDNKWVLLLNALQEKMIKLLNKKNIAIETMPTSNIRISFYENYEQHHIFNWHSPQGDQDKVKPNLVVASDDPGIFMNHLRAEYSHLYQTAIKKGATQQQTISWLKELNQNAKVFRF